MTPLPMPLTTPPETSMYLVIVAAVVLTAAQTLGAEVKRGEFCDARVTQRVGHSDSSVPPSRCACLSVIQFQQCVSGAFAEPTHVDGVAPMYLVYWDAMQAWREVRT